ncbi:porin [Thermomonas fusca]|uniref:Carbohydrate porin n=1 Tax=Thermomonas fusca TaxID=215690 RepID=A0A5R9PFY0_9GAMM|nr:porin [Thermomonas fusca]TLX21510.1 carbohydrate porin [Thermomonas fusca]
MRPTRLAVAIALIAGTVSFNAAAQSAPSAQDIAELKAQIAALQAQIQSLEERNDAQSDVNVAQAKTNEQLDDVASLKKLVNGTKLSGRLYYDLTNIDDSSKGVKTDKSGFAFDIKRFYLGVDHKFNDQWSMNLTTDFQYSSAIGATEIYLKKAYVQYKHNDAFVLRAGATDLPWVPFAENYYGMRYIENTLTDRLKFGTSTDWGLHAGGKVAGGSMEYAVAALNGNGYKNPSRSKGLDFEGRLSFAPTEQTVVGIGAYSGTLGKEKQTVDANHTANRLDFLAAYMSGKTRFGVEYFQANNWNNVTTLASDKASGWSVWGSMGLNEKGVTVFGRYDRSDVSKTLNPSLQDTYYNLGVEFPIAPGVKVATVYKHTDRRNDTRSTDLKTDEFGVWGEFRF